MKHLPRLLTIIILGLLTIILLFRLTGLELNQRALQRLNFLYLFLAVAIHYSGFVVRGIRWRLLLGGLGYRLSLVYTTSLLMAGWFVSALLPARLGDVARITMLNRDHQVGLPAGLASIASERALDILAILTLTMLAAFWALPAQIPAFVWQLLVGGLLFLVVFIGICLLSPRLETRLRYLVSWPLYRRVAGFGFDLLDHMRQLGRRPQLFAVVFGQSLYIWLCDILLMYFIFLGAGSAIAFSVAAFISMVIDLAAAVPILPGAIGQFEGAALAFLSLFDIGLQQSSAAILLNRFISFWSFMAVSGLVTYWFGFSRILKLEFAGQSQALPQEN